MGLLARSRQIRRIHVRRAPQGAFRPRRRKVPDIRPADKRPLHFTPPVPDVEGDVKAIGEGPRLFVGDRRYGPVPEGPDN